MAVAKRQGREKPMKIEQRKVRGPEGGPQVEQTALLASQEEKKIYKRKDQRVRALPCAGVLSHSLLFTSLGPHVLMPREWILLLFSK